MPIQQPEWLSRNNLRSFPIKENSPRIASSGFDIPNNLIVDAFIFAENETDGVCLSAICITSKLLTVVLSSVSSGKTLATASILSTTSASQRSIALNPVSSGVAGTITFGSFFDSDFSKFSNKYQGTNSFGLSCVLETRCTIGLTSFPIKSIRANRFPNKISGNVTIETPSGISIAETYGTDSDGEKLTFLTFSLDNPESFIPTCYETINKSLCLRPPILSINTAVPDSNGNINVVFDGITSSLFSNVLEAYYLVPKKNLCPDIPLPDSDGKLPPSFIN